MINQRLASKLGGEKALAGHVLTLLPYLEKHLSAFNGETVNIQSGNSAKFKKVAKAFREEGESILTNPKVNFHIEANEYSVLLIVKLSVSNPSGSTNFFSKNIYVGKVKDSLLEYDLDLPAQEGLCNVILETSLSSLEDKKDEIEALTAKIASIKASVHYSLQEIIV